MCLSYSCFSNVYVLAIGFTVAYVLFNPKKNEEDNKFFFSQIIDEIRCWVQRQADKKLYHQKQEESIIAKIRFYLNSELLESETIGALKLIDSKAQNNIDKIQERLRWLDKKLDFHAKSEYLNILAFNSAMYGGLILIIASLQGLNSEVHFGQIIIPFDILLIVSSLHCIISDRFNIKIKPTKMLYFSLFIIVLIIAFFYRENFTTYHLPQSYDNLLVIISIPLCLIWFIIYFILVSISAIILRINVWFKLKKIRIEDAVNEHNDDLKKYEDEFNQIDKKLLNVNEKDVIFPDESMTTTE